MNLFTYATKHKLRFDTPKGALSVEQLWDLPLEGNGANLYDIANELLTQIKSKPAKALSFFDKAKQVDSVTQIKFNIIEEIVTTRIAEANNQTQAAVAKSQVSKLDKLIAEKEDNELANLSVDELKKMRNKAAKGIV